MASNTMYPSTQVIEILSLLKRNHNVLLSGPPGVGKSRLLNQVKYWFQIRELPVHNPQSDVPLPDDSVLPDEAGEWLPSPTRTKREVFTTAFHPGSKYRDFVRGISPTIGKTQGFAVVDGVLYQAALCGLEKHGAALLIVDEINRGPAVQVFGDAIVALEADKRLDANGNEVDGQTQSFKVLDDNAKLVDFQLPNHLYVLAAMNQADTSVEPLDVAFLRRFEPFRLEPSIVAVRGHFGLVEITEPVPSPSPLTAEAVYEASAQAWLQVNRRIALGRGIEYQIGHGVFMTEPLPDNATAEQALQCVQGPWRRIRAHVDEVFFGHPRGVAAVFNEKAIGNPLKIVETFFATDPVVLLTGDPNTDLYAFLLAVAADDVQ